MLVCLKKTNKKKTKTIQSKKPKTETFHKERKDGGGLRSKRVLSLSISRGTTGNESFSDLGEIRVWLRADFQSGSRVLKKVF